MTKLSVTDYGSNNNRTRKVDASSRRMPEKAHAADAKAMTTPKERLHTVDEFVEKLEKTIRNRSI